MCTMIAEQTAVTGVGRGAAGWFPLDKAYVSYDHPQELGLEHALNIDFVNAAAGVSARVAVELDRSSARALAETILRTLEVSEGVD
jgi:hypothetical protein